jgi:predicted lipoprotein with Yx(FWY)xxD motif
MRTRSRTTFLMVGLAGVVSLAGLVACGNRPESPTGALQLPIAKTRTVSASPSPSTGGIAAADAPSEKLPVPEPTVAKTQKWVKIFSGPSKKDIKPNSDKKKGTHVVELNATENAQIGTFVTDGAGRTLYRFDLDRNKKSACNGDCTIAWPPLLIKSPGKIYPKGIDPKLISYIERADHSCQVAIAGQPVYYFIADNKPGDIKGQGINGKWFAISPTGARTKPIPGFPLDTTN